MIIVERVCSQYKHSSWTFELAELLAS